MNGGHIKVAAVIAIVATAALGLPEPRQTVEVPMETQISATNETWAIPDPCGLEDVICEGEEEVVWTIRSVTAYTSTVEQTDSTPCIAADGSDICERYANGESLCAANFVPFGTVLAIDTSDVPDGDDAIVCVVADRLSSRFPNRVDLYMGQDTPRAIQFGVQNLYVRVLDF